MPTLTAHDYAHLDATITRRRADNARDPSDPDYDEGGPEDVMTSIGYVQVWIDGYVVQNGEIIESIDCDG